jgi:hypothetical protein
MNEPLMVYVPFSLDDPREAKEQGIHFINAVYKNKRIGKNS